MSGGDEGAPWWGLEAMVVGPTVLEVARARGVTVEACFVDEEAHAEVAEVVATQTHRRTLWSGLGVDAVELSCFAMYDPDDPNPFRWRVFSARRGLYRGFVLALASSDDQAAAWAEAAQDPLWTVGTLGRDHLPEPDRMTATAAGDTRTLFARRDRAGARFRLVFEADDGSLWGTLEALPGKPTHALRRWDGRTLGQLELDASDPDTARIALDPAPALAGPDDDHPDPDAWTADALELAALEAAGLLAVLLVLDAA